MAKNIVVCCDGTGNEYGSNNTNVVKLYEAIVRDRDQAAFYDPGVGRPPPRFQSRLLAAVEAGAADHPGRRAHPQERAGAHGGSGAGVCAWQPAGAV